MKGSRLAAIQNNPVDHTAIGQLLGTAVYDTAFAVVAPVAADLSRQMETIETSANLWNDLTDDFQPNRVFSAAATGLRQSTKSGCEGTLMLFGFGYKQIVVLRLDGQTI